MVSSKTRRQKALIFIIFVSQKSNKSMPTLLLLLLLLLLYFVQVCSLQVLNFTMFTEVGMGVMALEFTPVSYLWIPKTGSSIVSILKHCCYSSSELELYRYTSPSRWQFYETVSRCVYVCLFICWCARALLYLYVCTRIFKKFPHFYIFAGNGEGGRSSNWSCLRVLCD